MKRFLFFVLVTLVAIAGCTGTTRAPSAPTALPTLAMPTATIAPTNSPQATITQADSPEPTTMQTPSPAPQPSPNPSPTNSIKILVEPTEPPQANPGATAITDPVLLKMIADAKADLAAVQNIPPDSIAIKSITPREWNDGSLGCPHRGVFYIQVILSGYIIVLEGAARDWEYHTGGNRVVLCNR